MEHWFGDISSPDSGVRESAVLAGFWCWSQVQRSLCLVFVLMV